MAMTEVTIYDIDVNRCLAIVHELRQTLDQDHDFSYKFFQGGYDWENNEHKSYKTVFSFRDPADATAFTLKYL
jgi:hypothetical protein